MNVFFKYKYFLLFAAYVACSFYFDWRFFSGPRDHARSSTYFADIVVRSISGGPAAGDREIIAAGASASPPTEPPPARPPCISCSITFATRNACPYVTSTVAGLLLTQRDGCCVAPPLSLVRARRRRLR